MATIILHVIIRCIYVFLERVYGVILMNITILENKLERFAESIEFFYKKIEQVLIKYVIDNILIVGEFFVKRIYTTKDKSGKFTSTEFYKKIRYLTFPFHWIWIISWMISKLGERDNFLFDKPGLFVIIGPPGCGKSSFVFMLIERLFKLFGKTSYINAANEKPRLSEDKSYKYLRYIIYSFTQFWNNRRTLEVPNHHIAESLVVEEGHRILNPRENNTTEYNDKFVPFMKYVVLVRKYIKRIFFITQVGKVDTQLMQLAQAIVQPRIDIGFDYSDWMIETGAFRFKILGFFVDIYTMDSNGEKSQKPTKSIYIKNEWADFDYFDTMAMNDAYDHIQMNKPNNLVKERIHVQ